MTFNRAFGIFFFFRQITAQIVHYLMGIIMHLFHPLILYQYYQFRLYLLLISVVASGILNMFLI